MAKVKTVTNYKASEIKKEITSKYVRNDTLELSILGYVGSGQREPFEEDEIYYCLSVHTPNFEFDIEVVESTSLPVVQQRQLALLNALHGYRGNNTVLVDYDESDGYYSDY